ncbi:RidA family protein [Aneurinibacillus tyrosinisolvens]|uniref:RidA family protein n=1 Tax=Aneurinibacillus tyrosinisolvens TaxID=1443435 RepID=UPI0009E4B555|nr:RidA family protein [Aneurinibacillus tyrosinisolvens]
MAKQQILTDFPLEKFFGYCPAIRIGNRIDIAGTAAIKNGEVVGVDNPYEQTKFIIETIKDILHELGADLSRVVRTRIFVTDISTWQEVARAHGEFFKDIQPASTLVEVKALMNPRLLVEIEAEAIISGE